MALLPIVIYPDPVLSSRAEEVEKVDKTLQGFIDDMIETMYHEDGAGLAAVQVGVAKRIFLTDITEDGSVDDNQKNLKIFINPVITNKSEESQMNKEGCLSFPGVYVDVKRHVWVDVEYLDYDGKKQKMHAVGWQAIAIQHEIDHLDGIVFSDHISKLKKSLIIKKMIKLKKKYII